MSSLKLELDVESVELQALRLQVQELMALNEKLVSSNEALENRVRKIEAENNILSLFAWTTAQGMIAYADRNRWFTGIHLAKEKAEGRLSCNEDVVVNNDSAFLHFQANGVQKEFNREFENPDGTRNFNKLVRHFSGFVQRQTI